MPDVDSDRITLPTPMPRLYLVAEAAELAGVGKWTIRNEIRLGNLRARRIGRLVRILDIDLAEWMAG